VPLTTAPTPTPVRAPAARRPPSAARAFAVGLVRAATVLVGLATAAITLGPRALVSDGMGFSETWLAAHPAAARLVEQLGGVEPAGNLFLFVPFAALLALCFRLRFLPLVLLALLCAPFAVEWLQHHLPGRVPDGNDIVRNTTGLLVAFSAVSGVRLLGYTAWRTIRAVA
jgi:hypothetical protein